MFAMNCSDEVVIKLDTENPDRSLQGNSTFPPLLILFWLVSYHKIFTSLRAQ